MRLDKYLKVSRLIKRRSVANDACDAERVSVEAKNDHLTRGDRAERVLDGAGS